MSSAAHITRPSRSSAASAINGKPPLVPPLQNGDHLTVAEFERRYEAMPQVKKAQLINGVVHTPSPVRIEDHGQQDSSIVGWLAHYHAYTPGTQLGGNTTMKVEVGESRPQPEAVLRILPEYGGQTRTEKGYVVGGAELVAEVSASTVSLEMHEKFDVYEVNRVQEYVVWRVEDKEIDWFILKNGKFRRLTQTKAGWYKSKAFPGLWLDAKAMIGGDLIKVLEVVQKGIASPEHQRFVAKLRAKKKR